MWQNNDKFCNEWHLRIPKPLLALIDLPGSALFLVMEGMLTDPLNPARLSWARTFYRSHQRPPQHTHGTDTHTCNEWHEHGMIKTN